MPLLAIGIVFDIMPIWVGHGGEVRGELWIAIAGGSNAAHVTDPVPFHHVVVLVDFHPLVVVTLDVQICGDFAILLFSSEFDLHSHYVLILSDGHIDIEVVSVSVFNRDVAHSRAISSRGCDRKYHRKVILDLVDTLIVEAVIHGGTHLAGEEVAVQFDLATHNLQVERCGV